MLKQNFIVVPTSSLIFAYVPKVACTNWKSTLRHLCGHHENYLDAAIAHDRTRNGLTYLDYLTEEQAEFYLRDPSIKRYSFVRNPYTRVLSAYLNKLDSYAKGAPQRGNDYFYTVFEAIRHWNFNERQRDDVDFLSFLFWLQHSDDPRTKNEHWLPQNRIIDPQTIRYDFVGRFENITTDAERLLRLMGSPLTFPTREAIKFPSAGTSDRLKEFTPGAMALIEQIYAEDFSLLNYTTGVLPRH